MTNNLQALKTTRMIKREWSCMQKNEKLTAYIIDKRVILKTLVQSKHILFMLHYKILFGYLKINKNVV